MPPGFWHNWWVNVAIAFGTIGAVVVALFGQYFREKFFPPLLSMRVNSLDGSKARERIDDTNAGTWRMEDARYWHVRVTNGRRWSLAHDTQVYLLRVEEPGPDGKPRIVWQGEGVPIRWQHQEVHPLRRTLGSPALADLCNVTKGKWLALHPIVVPYSLEPRYRKAGIVIVTLQARSNEADSPRLRVQIAWDGGWADGADDMRDHLRIEELADLVDGAGAG